ncbi:MAG TPA: cytochrome P450 [Solirubrobacteraceae bacterium]|nr:cytochrome P450 [Solirubrobacteraceae bacterium]
MTANALPPGPRLPRLIQTAGFILGGTRFLEACRRRYGNVVTLGTLFDSGFVMVFDPALIKEVFQGSNDQLHAGEANALLGPVLGERSVLLLDGAEHLRHRRLMLPTFHGEQMRVWTDAMAKAADVEIDAWPVGEPFSMLRTMQAATLRVIIRVVFGYEPGPEADELQRRLREMIDPVARPRGLLLLQLLDRFGARNRAVSRFEAQRRAVDELVYAEIARRRAEPDLAERTDIFSALLLAEDENGERLTDNEVRDELMTLLLAGHETTAVGLAWIFDLLLHTPDVHRRAAEGDDEYLDAVVKEALRLRPVIPAVGRVVRGRPFTLGGYEIPVGMEINPSIRIIHRRADLYPEPQRFRPERFLGPDAPDTYTWIPFGGGTRRCLGASFALTEMRIVLGRVLERCALRPASPELEEVMFRGITLAPKAGVQVVLDRPPAPAPEPAAELQSAA